MFEAIDICYQRGGRRLFAGLSFKLGQGQALYIKGENGAGKSSLLKLLTGVSQADQGDVLWQGKSIRHDEYAFHSNLLFIGHKSGLNIHLNALENLAWYQRIDNLEIEQEHCKDIFKALGLYGFEDIPVGKLSAGQQRRIALCRLLFSKKRLWVLDEPLVSLDQSGVQLFQSILQNHLMQGGMLVFTSHQELMIEDASLQSIDLGDYKTDSSETRE